MTYNRLKQIRWEMPEQPPEPDTEEPYKGPFIAMIGLGIAAFCYAAFAAGYWVCDAVYHAIWR